MAICSDCGMEYDEDNETQPCCPDCGFESSNWIPRDDPYCGCDRDEADDMDDGFEPATEAGEYQPDDDPMVPCPPWELVQPDARDAAAVRRLEAKLGGDLIWKRTRSDPDEGSKAPAANGAPAAPDLPGDDCDPQTL